MTDRRWQLVDIQTARTVSGGRYSGSGTSSVNGDYYEDTTPYAGKLVWTKVGGNFLEDSIHYEPTLSKYIITSGGTFTAASTNAKYDTPEDPNTTGIVSTTWYARTGASTPPGGGALPAPNTVVLGVDLTYIIPETTTVLRDFGPMQYAKFSEDEDLSVGCKALRRKLTTDLVFTGDDFDYFRVIERNPVRRCEEMIIRRQYRCGGMWKTVWTGTFSTGAGEWDLDNCEFTVRPDVLDEYTCIMRAMNKKVNVLQVGYVDAKAVIIPSLQFGACVPGLPNDCPDILDDDGVTPIDEYESANGQTVPYACGGGGSYTLTIYWRERQQTFCIDGSPVSPIGAGWVLLQDNCASDGTAVYVRNSTIAWTFGDATIVESDSPIPTPPDDSCAWSYLGTVDVQATVNPLCPPTYHHAYICLTSGDAVEFPRARTLQGIANYMLEKSGCDQTEMVSDLLEWNAPGDAPGYAPGMNYVTGTANQYNAIVALQNSDAIDPAASNPATIGELSLKELFTVLAIGPKLFWAIDDQGRIRIEHWSFWTTPVGLDIVAYAKENKSEPFTYVHLKDEVPRYERPKWAEAQGADFIGADIEYSGPCVSTEGDKDVKEYNAGPFTTDLPYIVSDPDAITKQGFTLLATTFDGSVYNTILDDGALTGNFITNAPMSWANLERDFWQHDRFLPTGKMNRVDTEFIAFQPNIEQKGVFLKFCCDYVDFDSSERVHTGLGVKLGNINAFVRRAEFDEATDGLTLTLRYAY